MEELIMRKLFGTLAFVLLAISFSFAQKPGPALQNAEKNYLIGLNHQNPGVVESAIINTMVLKLYYPEKDFSNIIIKLDNISLENPEKIVRVKAFIASNYLKHPDRFNWIEKGDYESAVKFFQLYSARLDKQMNNTGKTEITMTK